MKKSTKITLLVAGALVILLGMIGITYAFFSTGGSQEQANTFTSGCLNISLTDASSSISLSNIYPITDVEGLEGTSYDFTITNTCNTSTNYSINLESLNQVSNSLSADYIKVALSSDTVGNVISILSDNTSVTPEIDGAYESYNLYTGTLGASEAKTYHLKLWLDYDATVEQAANKVYSSKINVIANSETQVVDTLEATFELNDTTLTSNLTSNVTSATYCTTTDNICTPGTSAIIEDNKYTVEMGSNANMQMICTKLNETSKLICGSPIKITAKDIILADNEVNGVPNFNQIATADEEMYTTLDNLGTSYYFRGAVTNNYVQFAGYYWRIIRINGDDSIRLIYDGTSAHANGESSADRQIQTSVYSTSLNYNYSYYVGFTYQANTQRPLVQNEEISSTIKNVLDNWYTEHLQEFDNIIISKPGFCNDRNSYSDENGITSSWVANGAVIYYSAYIRVVTNKTPTLQCNNNSDWYITNIGLITADEVLMAGGGYLTNNDSYYLYTGQNYWTMSPYNFNGNNAVMFAVDLYGILGWDYVSIEWGVRPVINLSADVTISSGDGTINNPYVIA